MPLSDIFKRKKSEKKPKEVVKEKEAKKEIKKEKPVSPKPEASPYVSKKREKVIGHGQIILKSVHVTEKASDLAKKNQYVFKTVPEANKTEIKRAVENLYGVDVLGVRIINVPRKARRMGKQTGWKKGYKKAIVKIKAGQEIEVLPR